MSADKLVELIKQHRPDYEDYHGSHYGCICGAGRAQPTPMGLDEGDDWHAEHLAKIICEAEVLDCRLVSTSGEYPVHRVGCTRGAA